MNSIFNFLSDLARWSEKTFKPGRRTKGLIKHIEKELDEVRNAPNDYQRAEEWVDIAMLALDGAIRSLNGCPAMAEDVLRRKFLAVQLREWPEQTSEDEPCEHVREDLTTLRRQTMEGYLKLHQMARAGTDESPEGEAVRDAMDEPWDRLGEVDRQWIGLLSEALQRMYLSAQPPGHQDVGKVWVSQQTAEDIESWLALKPQDFELKPGMVFHVEACRTVEEVRDAILRGYQVPGLPQPGVWLHDIDEHLPLMAGGYGPVVLDHTGKPAEVPPATAPRNVQFEAYASYGVPFQYVDESQPRTEEPDGDPIPQVD